MESGGSTVKGVRTVVGCYVISVVIDREPAVGDPVGVTPHSDAVVRFCRFKVLRDAIESKYDIDEIAMFVWDEKADNARTVVGDGNRHSARVLQYNKVRVFVRNPVFEIPWLRQSVVAHNLSYSCITLVPADILAIYASSCLPVFSLYISLTLSITSGTRSACTRLIVHPPKPPPI